MEYIPAKHLLHRNRGTEWFGTDHTMNIYRGCCHGCLYCDSRSSCYQNPDFDTVKAKAGALTILRDDLARKTRPAFINMGSMSDPYNPFEEELELTRHALELIDAYGCGVAAATKSDLIVRDIDLYQFIQRHSPVICKLTVTTTDDAEGAGGSGDLFRCPAYAGPALAGGQRRKCAVGGGGGCRGGSTIRLFGLRCDHAGWAEGAFSKRTGPGFSRTGAGGEIPPAVWKPVYLLQSQSGEVVGTIFQTLRGAGAVV